MNQELLDAIKKRKKQVGGTEDSEQKPIPKSEVPVVQHNVQGFNKNKAMLENLFGKKHEAEAPAVEVKKEEPKGDQKNFSNAKNLLQQQFGKAGDTNVLNIQPTAGLPNLPPPPPSMPIGNLPLPPPPPPINLANLPLPPPPLNLPPPPPLNLPLPSFNLPPPPSNLPAKTINLPPPPINLPPPPSNLPPPSSQINLPPPPNLPPPANLPPPVNNLPPPPPPQYQTIQQPKQQVNVSANYKTNYHNLPPPQPPIQIPQSPLSYISSSTKQAEDEPLFILNDSNNKPPPAKKQHSKQTTAWEQKQLQKSRRKKLFDKKNPKRFPLTEQFFGINLAGLIKQEFLKSANIPSTIGLEVRKKHYDINFPTIQNKLRAIEPIQTLYADTQSLDLVSCFMNKNLNAAKLHNDQKDVFLAQFTNYNWQADTLKLKNIKEAAQVLPNSTFMEPNFVAIKNATVRCMGLIQTLVKTLQFQKCDQIKKLIDDTERKVKQYCSNPQNENLLNSIEQNVHQMKNINI